MPSALYFPFSRCLDLTALKQAVLLYDELLFVDPVDPQARSELYQQEAEAVGADPTVTARWRLAEDAYERLSQAGVVRTVSSEVLRDPDAAEALAVGSLHVDLDYNRAAQFFPGHHRWQILADRMPRSLRSGAFGAEVARGWGDHSILKVPYAVGASVTTTYALAIAQEQGAVPMTDSPGAHRLLLERLRAAAAAEGNLPGLHAPPSSPYLRRQIELRLVDELAPAEALRSMSVGEVLDYRVRSASVRQELGGWIDKLVQETRRRPWDSQLELELADIAHRAREIAAKPGRWGAAVAAGRPHLTPGAIASQAVKLGPPPTVAALVATDVSLLGALAIGGAAVSGQAIEALSAAVRALLAKRPAEQNAVSYLLNASAH